MLRILICENHLPLRYGLRRLLETQRGWEVVGEVPDGNEVVKKSLELQPDIVILDHIMPEHDGVRAAQRIRHAAPQAEIVMLTYHDSCFTVRRALKAGVRSYVVKFDAGRELLAAIKAATEHRTFVSSAIRKAEQSPP